jgi:molecular chaperone GrpE
MALRLASSRALLKGCFKSSKILPYFKYKYPANFHLMGKTANSSMYYMQSRGIFWNDKKPKEEQPQSEKPSQEPEPEPEKTQEAQEEQNTNNTNTKAKSAAAEENPKTQETKPQQEESAQKAQTKKPEPVKKPQTKSEEPEKFETLLEDPTPENKKKLFALWTKLEKDMEAKNKELEKKKSMYSILEKSSAENKSKIEDLRARLKEEIEERELMRKRFDKELEQTKVFAITKFAKELIEVPDNLARALDSAKNLEGKNDALYEGLKITNNMLLKILEKHGITKIEPLGQKFDPNYHEALCDFPDPTKKSGTCGFVAGSGYMINDRVLKPAKVGVVKNLESAQEQQESSESEEEETKKTEKVQKL